MRKKKVAAKSGAEKNAKQSVKKTAAKRAAPKMKAKIAKKNTTSQSKLAASVVAAANPGVHSSRRFFRSVVSWGFIAVLAFFAISLFMYYAGSSEAERKQFDEKLAQVATLNVLRSDEPLTLLAVGNILPARYTELLMRQKNDYTHPFQNTAEFLKKADIAFGNLESPLLPGRNVPEGNMVFRADLRAAEGLSFAGFDVLSIANNQMMNYQVPGLTSTIQQLKKAGIAHVGAGKNLDSAHTPAIFEAKDLRVAFYAYSDFSIPPGFHSEAGRNTPGIARMDIETVKNDVKNALASGADVVVVSMHAGKEYTREPTPFQKDFSRAAIDAGASVVLGHHPHWVQPYEVYGNGVIFYSLGNFVFDQFFSEDVQTGLIAQVKISGKGKRPEVEVFPVKIEKTVPRILEGEEREKELQRLGL